MIPSDTKQSLLVTKFNYNVALYEVSALVSCCSS